MEDRELKIIEDGRQRTEDNKGWKIQPFFT
jgi:hypothetical protein